VLEAEDGERGGRECEQSTVLWRQAEPARCEHAQQVTVGEQGDVAGRASQVLDQGIHARADIGGPLSAGTAVAPEAPARAPLVDLGGRDPLVLTVVPLEQGLARLGRVAEPGQAARLTSPLERTRDHALEVPLSERSGEDRRRASPGLGQREIGSAGVAEVPAPFSLAVSDEDDLVHPADAFTPGMRCASQGVSSSAGSGRLTPKPWMRSQPSSVSRV